MKESKEIFREWFKANLFGGVTPSDDRRERYRKELKLKKTEARAICLEEAKK
tara:strand:+ start:288 stop:443 length:156 start_codon:yes stop_codon:yes gene_type:complete